MVKLFFFTKYMASDDFLNPFDALIPKNPFPFLAEFGVGVTSGPRGQFRWDFGGPIN